MLEKICLVTKLMNQDREEVYYAKEQMDMGWEGLTKEVIRFCEDVGLANPCKEYLNRQEVAEAVLYCHLILLKEQYSMEKLKHLKNTKVRYMHKYLSSITGERKAGVPIRCENVGYKS